VTPQQLISELLQQWDDFEFSGLVSVHHQEITCQHASNFRNKSEALRNTKDTLFPIASGTKLFTAVAICQLIDQGKLSLDSQLGTLLAHEKLGNLRHETTVFQMLTHTSGVPDYIDEAIYPEGFYQLHPPRSWTRMDYPLPLFNQSPNISTGSHAEYSNSGFVLLGLIIEAVTTMSYHDYVKTHILEPMNMERTGFYASDNLPHNTALGYYEGRANTLLSPIIGSSDGGIYTTADEMAQFWQGLFNGSMLSTEMLAQMTTIHSQKEWSPHIIERFGLGIIIKEVNGTPIYGHGGSEAGISFITLHCPKTYKITTIFENTENDIWRSYPKLWEWLAE